MRWKILSVFLAVFCSCSSTQGSGKGTMTDQKVSMNDFPIITVSTLSNGDIPSYFDADIVDNPLSTEGQKMFGENVVYSLSSTYKLYDKENTINYYVIVFDFKKTIDETENVKRRNIIGKSTGKDPKILVFCKTIDPFFVLTCRNMPISYDDFYWFEASFLFSSEGKSGNPKWLYFEPTDNIEKLLIDIADHVNETSPSFDFYPGNFYRFKTKLEEYPREINKDEIIRVLLTEKMTFNRTGITTHISEFKAGQYIYKLCWQEGFDKYLKKEYKLKKDIWVCGAVVTYSKRDNCGYIFIRDFQLIPLEEVYENRVKMIKQRGLMRE